MGMLFSALSIHADVDPNFYIYLCFGQSNMEGATKWEAVDTKYVDPRFQMLATTNFDSPKRTMGNWYKATCPIVSPVGKLGMCDYFGRTMVAALPAGSKVGVIAVAMGGSPIEMFDKDLYQQKLKDNPNEWWAILAKNYYGSNPYGRLIDMAKKAQEVGVIKGILLHQGCSNCGDSRWPGMVKKIYNDMLSDLGLKAADVPLFVGETERADMGGGCASHNVVVAKMPDVVPTSHVVSSEGIPGNGEDGWHFSAAGYRTFGKRYAIEALKVMGREVKKDDEYTLPDNLTNFFTLKSLDEVADITMRVGASKQIQLWGTFADGHRENLTSEAVFSSTDFTLEGNVVTATEAKSGTVTATYTDFTSQVHTQTIHIEASDEGPNHILVVSNGSAGSNAWDKQLHCVLKTPMTKGKKYVVKATIKADKRGACALWPIWDASPNRNQWGGSDDVQYLSSYNITTTFKEYTWDFTASFDHDILQFVFGLIGGNVYFDDVSCVEKGTTKEMVPNGNFESDDISAWSVLGYMGQSVALKEDIPADISTVVIEKNDNIYYNLHGQRVAVPGKGVYIVNGKKIVSR